MANVDAVFDLFEKHGHEIYQGESVDQMSHMIQTAMAAEKDGQSPEVILGSLLHDIGNLVGHDKPEVEMIMHNLSACGDSDPHHVNIGPKDHDRLGEEYLKEHGIPFEIYCFCLGHTQAVRYIAWKDKNYAASLPKPSQKTLERRGGPFTDQEAAEFAKLPHADAIVKCRVWDEAAIDPKATLEPLNKYRQMMKDYIAKK